MAIAMQWVNSLVSATLTFIAQSTFTLTPSLYDPRWLLVFLIVTLIIAAKIEN